MRETFKKVLPTLARFAARDWRRPHWRILYYHAVLPAHRDTFAAQLDWFSERFSWCTVDYGCEALTRPELLGGPLLSLTFDDADRTLLDVVLPLLMDRGISACVYVVPTYVERGGSYRDETPRPIMSWSGIEEWLSTGNEVGSHTYTHAPLVRCSDERLRQEARWSRWELEQKLSIPVRHFAYPWGQHNERTKRRIHDGGEYESMATILRGRMIGGHDRLALRRDRGDPDKSPEQVVAMMQLADRLYWLRRLRKHHSRLYWERHPEERFDAIDPVPAAVQAADTGLFMTNQAIP